MPTLEIPLTQGKTAIVDEKDYADLSQFKWHFNHGYAARRIGARKTHAHEYMHKRILPCKDERVVIHLDDNRLNNCRANLILAPKAIRQQRMAPRGACGYKGVSYVKGQYVAQIHFLGKTLHLGRYSEALDAARAYDLAALNHYGLAAKLNFSLTARELSIIVRGN